MHNSYRSNKYFNLIFATLLYFVGVVVYVFFVYSNTKVQLINQIDQRLRMATVAVSNIIPDNFHNKMQDETSLSLQEDYALAMRLTDYVNSVDIAYVYTLKRFSDDKIRFTSSSATPEEVENNNYKKAYYGAYPEMPSELLRTFNQGKESFSEYTDRWGSFRSIFILKKTNKGTEYVIGADISMAEIKAVVFQSVVSALFAFCFLAIIVIPLLYSFIQSMHKNWKRRYDALFIDSLTGLPNRRQLSHDIELSIHTNLAIININQFRNIMTNFGAAIGDEILKQFAQRLVSAKPSELKSYKVYRLYADEFAVLVDQKLTKQQINEISTEGLIHLIRYPYLISATKNLQLDVTIGAVFQKNEAFSLAEMALGEAKSRHLRLFAYDNTTKFLPEIYTENMIKVSLLKSALSEGRLAAYRQPILDAKTLKVKKYELLARIVDESGRVKLLPDEFIPLAYRAKVYYKVIRIMLNKAIDIAKEEGIHVSINIDVSDINNQRTQSFIFDRLKSSGLAEYIQFELLENEVITDYAEVIGFIKKIKSLGASIGIDDLGKGHSNFDRLISLPVDFVKIDRSIMLYILKDKDALAVTKTILELAHKNGLKVIAEYCETKEIADIAIELGVDYLQGYYFGEPVVEL